MAIQKLPIHRLPLPSKTLQHALSELPLSDQPSAQRRATTFKSSSEGVWARTHPLWASWPLRITKEDALAMGVDVEKGEQISVEDVLRRWDPVSIEHTGIPHDPEEESNGLNTFSSTHREKIEPILLGISTATLNDRLPHLTVGDATTICNRGASPSPDATPAALVRNAFTDILSGKKILKSEKPEEGGEKIYGPWSTRYCGHQFGTWAGQLGDGRAVSVLETESEAGGRQELQLKGAGRTPFSRTADGLAVLRSGVREFVGCEAIAALDIRTTRALALLTVPFPSLPVIREQGPEPSSLLCRVAPSFIRIGHFEALNPSESAQRSRQIFIGSSGWLNDESEGEAQEGNLEGLRKLTEWVKDDIMGMKGSTIKEWVEEVVARNAKTVAQWQAYGWMHGVLNTDNISLTGDTIDFGPYAFMDVYDDKHICNHSDPSGLYSYRNQPSRVLFALDKLVSSLAPLIGYEALHSSPPSAGFNEGLSKETRKEWEEKADEIMDGWDKKFWEVEKDEEKKGWLKHNTGDLCRQTGRQWVRELLTFCNSNRGRFGLKTYRDSDDREIISDYLSLLMAHRIDFHTSFRLLSSFLPSAIVKGDDQSKTHLNESVERFVRETTTARPGDSVGPAQEAFKAWFKIYAERAAVPEEVSAYATNSTSNGTSGESGEGPNEQFEVARKQYLNSVNPRFVLRQWVLEETIAKMEESLTSSYVGAKGEKGPEEWEVEQGVRDARKVLAKILDMATRPFQPYGEGVKPSSSSAAQEFEEDARLCGLGQKEMLGFQCSCSS